MKTHNLKWVRLLLLCESEWLRVFFLVDVSSSRCRFLETGVLVFSLFLVDFNGTLRIHASPYCWVYSWSLAQHVTKLQQHMMRSSRGDLDKIGCASLRK